MAPLTMLRSPSPDDAASGRRTVQGVIRRQRLLVVDPGRRGGSAASHLVAVARAMAAAGHEVAAVVPPDGCVRDALAGGGDVRLLDGPLSRTGTPRARDVARAAHAVGADWMIGTLDADLLPFAVAARLLRTPLALLASRDPGPRPSTMRVLSRLARRIVAPSEYQRRRLLDCGVPASRVAVLYAPVDTARLHVDAVTRHQARTALGFRHDDVVVGFVGRLEPERGVDALAAALRRAMCRDPRLRALWVGDGQCEATLREAVSHWGHAGRHVWHPWTADVRPLYAAMDVLALPSIGREPFGRVLVEAQACGVPVLGSRTGGIPEAMEDGVTGLLLPPADVPAWTDALLRLADDAPGRRGMGRTGQEFVARVFDSRIIAAELGRLLTDAGADDGRGGW